MPQPGLRLCLDLHRFRSGLLKAILAIKGRPMRSTDLAAIHSDAFKRDAVHIALSNGLTRRQVGSDLGIGLSTLSKWVRAVSEVHRVGIVPAWIASQLRPQGRHNSDVGRGHRLPCRWSETACCLKTAGHISRLREGRPSTSPQGRGSDDATVRTGADTDRARQRDGHIGIALDQHHAGGHRADQGPKMHPGASQTKARPQGWSRTDQLCPPACQRPHQRDQKGLSRETPLPKT
jgi:transposase